MLHLYTHTVNMKRNNVIVFILVAVILITAIVAYTDKWIRDRNSHTTDVLHTHNAMDFGRSTNINYPGCSVTCRFVKVPTFGPIGLNGTKGEQGPIGVQGPIGLNGTKDISYVSESFIDLLSVYGIMQDYTTFISVTVPSSGVWFAQFTANLAGAYGTAVSIALFVDETIHPGTEQAFFVISGGTTSAGPAGVSVSIITMIPYIHAGTSLSIKWKSDAGKKDDSYANARSLVAMKMR